jgi:uncharacterized protein
MRVGIFINTVDQAYFYTKIAEQLRKDGHETFLVAREQSIVFEILSEMGIPFFPYSSTPGKIYKITSFPAGIISAYRYLKEKKVEIVTGFGIYCSCVAFMLGVPDITFCDSESGMYPASYAVPFRFFTRFSSCFVTPAPYWEHIGSKQLYVESNKELAYLRPGQYTPDNSIFKYLGIPPGSDYVIVRFNSHNAVHDVGLKGFGDADKIRLVKELEKHMRVFITSDAGVPGEIRDRVVRFPKNSIHDALYYARLLVADSGTLTMEAAVLGTPAIRSNSFVDNDAGVMKEFGGKYGLILNIADPHEAIDKAIELVLQPGLKQEWKARRDRYLKDKIDMDTFMAWLIGNFPESFRKIKENPGVQRLFKQPVPARN